MYMLVYIASENMTYLTKRVYGRIYLFISSLFVQIVTLPSLNSIYYLIYFSI